jgi:hypothetical protein
MILRIGLQWYKARQKKLIGKPTNQCFFESVVNDKSIGMIVIITLPFNVVLVSYYPNLK